MDQLKRVLRLVTHHFGWKVLALASAFVIWALVASEPELSTFTTVRLEYRNLPDNLEISSAPAETVTLELRGPAGELRGTGDNRRPAVMLDMSNVMPGRSTFTIGDGNVSLARGVRLVRAIPSEVPFEFESRASRTVPVQIHFAGLGASDYVVSEASVSPSELTIEGPASHVARIMSVSTDPLNVSSVTGTAEFHVNAFVSDPYDRFEGSSQVVVTVTMKKK